MIKFVSLTKHKALRKAISFWYKHYYGRINLKEFIGKCVGKQTDKEYIIIYKGSSPGENN